MKNLPYSDTTNMLYKGKVVKGMDFNKPAVFPYFPTTSFTMNSLSEVKSSYQNNYTYIRNNNPNRDALADVVTFLEKGERSLIFSSGMGAITTTLLTLLKPGDEILCNSNIYGETYQVLASLLPKFGVNTVFVDFCDLKNARKAISPATKLVYSEVCTNPTLCIADVPELANIAHTNGALLMIDNTFTTAIAIKPITLGADIVINSLTKFMNGHSDALGGSITASADIIDQISPVRMIVGTSGDPYASFTMLKNFATMDLRVNKQMQNAYRLATALEAHQHISRINHPGLESYPQHALAMRLFHSAESISGMMSIIVPENEQKIDEFMQRLEFAHYAVTLGGVHTTMLHPVTSSHRLMPDEKRRAMGITPGMIRISVGIENVDDLIADFSQALGAFDA